jgi:hypothetical protein
MAIFRVGNKSEEVNFPSIRPTLDLDFANTKTLDHRIAFTRPSGGSYVGPDGLIKYAGVNQPRFDHDPVTEESLGLLVEERRTNLILESNTGTRCIVQIDSSIISPDGTNSAYKITSTANSGNVFSSSPNTITNSSGSPKNYCWSVFVKQATPITELVRVQFGGINTARVLYIFNTDTLSSLGIPSSNYGRILYPNGWVRLYGYTSIPPGSIFNLIVIIPSVEARGEKNASVYKWGEQIEEGKFPTSYIPTVSSTRTRAADNVLITDKNFSDFYNPLESTIFTEARGVNLIEDNRFTRRYWELYTNMGSRILSGYGNLDSTRVLSLNNSITSANIININQSPGTKFIKNIASFKDNYFSTYSNGENNYERNQIFGKLPSVTTIRIGSSVNTAFGTTLNGTIKRFIYWPKILSDGQLQALTK